MVFVDRQTTAPGIAHILYEESLGAFPVVSAGQLVLHSGLPLNSSHFFLLPLVYR